MCIKITIIPIYLVQNLRYATYMNLNLPKTTKYLSYSVVTICSLLFFQSIVLAVTHTNSSLGTLLTEVLFSFLQFIPALPALLFVKLIKASQKKWLQWCMVVYSLNFMIAIINLLFIANTSLQAGLPIVLIIWPFALIVSVLISWQNQSKK